MSSLSTGGHSGRAGGSAASTTDSTVHCSSQETVLPKHYESFLGIGDVFVQAPTHALPMTYYYHSNDASPNNVGGTFVSTEMVGRLKTTPQDFIVQEIMNVKNLFVGNNDNAKEDDTVQVATLEDSPLREPSETVEEQPSTNQKETPTTTRATEAASQTRPEIPHERIETMIDWNRAEREPRQVLETIIQSSGNQLVLVQSPGQLIQELSQLQANAIQSLLEDPSTPDVSSNDSSTVKIMLQGSSQRQDRGRLHKWVRSAFCMLQTDVIPKNPSHDQNDTVTIQVNADDRFMGLTPFLHDPLLDLPRLYSFFRRGHQCTSLESLSSSSSSLSHKGLKNNTPKNRDREQGHHILLPLRVDLERSQRREIHQLLAEKSGRQFQTDTVTDHSIDNSTTKTAAIIVSWSRRGNSRKRKYNQDGLVATTCSPPTYTLLILQKRNVEHTVALHLLSKAFRCPTSDIQYAGIKDRRAITTQFISVLDKHVSVKRIIASQTSLRSQGLDLGGPLRTIKQGLRRGQAQGNRFAIVLRALKQVRVYVDNVSGKTKEELISCQRDNMDTAVERLCQHGFVNFFGEQRIGTMAVKDGTRPVDIGRAMMRHDWKVVIDLILRIGTDINSMRVSKVWQDSQGDAVETWKALSRSQGGESRQRVILQSLKRHGGDVKLAVQSLSNYDRTFWIYAYQSFVWNMAATERIRLYSAERVVVGDLVESPLDRTLDGPVVVTSDEMALRFSIQDVVLPLPGYDMKYPSNKVGDVYKDVLARDEIEFVKDAPLDATGKGSYRWLISTASNFEHKWLETDESCQFRFDLPSGSYATMLFRELLRTTVSR